MRVLVTGAGGFVGRNLLPVLVAEGFHVVGVIREPSPSSVPLPQDGPGSLALVAGDLTQGLDLTQSVDVVVHAASKLSVDTSVSEDAHILNNALATRRLIDDVISAGARQLIFLSSILVYEAGITVDETENLKLNEGAAKRLFSADEILSGARPIIPVDLMALQLHLMHRGLMPRPNLMDA